MRVQAAKKKKNRPVTYLPHRGEALHVQGKRIKKRKTDHNRQALFLFSFKNRLLLLFDIVQQIVQAVILQRR